MPDAYLDSGAAALKELSTLEYFGVEYCRFREMMCSTKFSREAKKTGLGAITLLYFNLPEKDAKKVENSWLALLDEFARRDAYEAMREINSKIRDADELRDANGGEDGNQVR